MTDQSNGSRALMRASVLSGPERSEIEKRPIPRPEPDGVVIRVKACGVCRSELHEWEGETGAMAAEIIGHEPSGIIEAVGPEVTNLKPGQRVTCFPATDETYGVYTSGGFAEYVAVPAVNTISIPDHMDFRVSLGEPLACLVSALNRTPIMAGDRVALIGCGFMGLAMMQLAALRGPVEVVAIDVRESALDQALALGADRVLTPSMVSDREKALGWDSLGNGFDVVFEVSGTQAGLDLAADITRAHGTLSVVGYHTGGNRSVDMAFWNLKAITVLNAHERRRDYFMECMRTGISLLGAGKLNMDSLVTHEYGLDQVDSAFRDLRDKPEGYIKGIVIP